MDLAMFGLGDITPVIKAMMSGDKNAMVGMLKPYLPDLLRMVMTGAILAADGDPEKDGAFLWQYAKPDGTTTVMATVYRRSPLDEPMDTIGTIDLLESVDRLDLTQFLK